MADRTVQATESRPLEIVAAVNRDDGFDKNLFAAPDVRAGGALVRAQRGHRSAGSAYNAGLDQCEGDVVAFVHQDVYLPRGWVGKVRNAVARLGVQRAPWGLLGVWGVTGNGRFV